MPVGWVLLDTQCSRTAKVLPSNSQSTFQEYSLTDAWNSRPLPVFLLVKSVIWVITESKHQKSMNLDRTELVLRWSRWCKFYLWCLHSSCIGSRNLWGIKRVAYGLTYLSSSQMNCAWVGQQKASFPAMGISAPKPLFLLQYGIAQTPVLLPLSANSAVFLVPHNSNCELERKKWRLFLTSDNSCPIRGAGWSLLETHSRFPKVLLQQDQTVLCDHRWPIPCARGL